MKINRIQTICMNKVFYKLISSVGHLANFNYRKDQFTCAYNYIVYIVIIKLTLYKVRSSGKDLETVEIENNYKYYHETTLSSIK